MDSYNPQTLPSNQPLHQQFETEKGEDLLEKLAIPLPQLKSLAPTQSWEMPRFIAYLGPPRLAEGQAAPVLSQVFSQLHCNLDPLDFFQSSLHSWVLQVCLDCTYGYVYTVFIWFDTLATGSVIGKTESSGCFIPDLLNAF